MTLGITTLGKVTLSIKVFNIMKFIITAICNVIQQNDYHHTDAALRHSVY
jgi:hypothetical protein